MEDKNKENSDKEVRKKLSIVFLSKNEKKSLLALLIILLIGWGPGELIASKPVLIMGVPALWLWWICWWVVWVIAMYFLIYKSGENEFED
ncbi:MAG: hypothetical protein ACOX74_02390 [Lachnospiraceae bacterium]|jgi:hypothetical protein